MLKFVYGHKCHSSDVRVLSNGDLTETHSCGYPEIEKKIVQRRGGGFQNAGDGDCPSHICGNFTI